MVALRADCLSCYPYIMMGLVLGFLFRTNPYVQLSTTVLLVPLINYSPEKLRTACLELMKWLPGSILCCRCLMHWRMQYYEQLILTIPTCLQPMNQPARVRLSSYTRFSADFMNTNAPEAVEGFFGFDYGRKVVQRYQKMKIKWRQTYLIAYCGKALKCRGYAVIFKNFMSINLKVWRCG